MNNDPNNTPNYILGPFLREKRLLSGKSQAAVARALGYGSPQFISNWERGISQPPLETLAVLADLYSISVDKMFEIMLKDTEKRVEADLRAKFQALQN